jgi:hypothetical protein
VRSYGCGFRVYYIDSPRGSILDVGLEEGGNSTFAAHYFFRTMTFPPKMCLFCSSPVVNLTIHESGQSVHETTRHLATELVGS